MKTLYITSVPLCLRIRFRSVLRMHLFIFFNASTVRWVARTSEVGPERFLPIVGACIGVKGREVVSTNSTR